MLVWRIKELLEGSGELLKAEAELASVRIRRMLVGLAALCFIGLIGIVGLIAVLAGLSYLIAQSAGWGVSLLIVGGGVMLLTAIGGAIVLKVTTDQQAETAIGSIGTEETPPEADIANAKERMHQAVEDEPADQPDDNPLSGFEKLKDEAIDYAVRNPVMVGSAALLVMSAIGPSRSVRMISKSVATAGLVSKLLDGLNDTDAEPEAQHDQHAHHRNGHAAAQHPRTPA